MNEHTEKNALVFQGQTYPFREEYQDSQFVRGNLPWFQRFSSINLQEVCEGTKKYNPLLKTMYEQPAILAVELLRAREDEGHRHYAFMGHSFGELIALRKVGVIKCDEEAMYLAENRGRFMAEANLNRHGSMVALMGNLDMNDIRDICKKNGVYIANINVPDEQIVISGETHSVKKACRIFGKQGLRVIPIDIGGAFHCPEMEEAQSRFQDALESIRFNPPRAETSLIMMSTGQIETNPDAIKGYLARQLTEPVDLQKAVKTLAELRVENIHEVGSKKTLTGFIRKIMRKLSRNR